MGPLKARQQTVMTATQDRQTDKETVRQHVMKPPAGSYELQTADSEGKKK